MFQLLNMMKIVPYEAHMARVNKLEGTIRHMINSHERQLIKQKREHNAIQGELKRTIRELRQILNFSKNPESDVIQLLADARVENAKILEKLREHNEMIAHLQAGGKWYNHSDDPEKQSAYNQMSVSLGNESAYEPGGR